MSKRKEIKVRTKIEPHQRKISMKPKADAALRKSKKNW